MGEQTERAIAHTTASAETKRRVLVATVLGSGLVFLDASVANVALPAIQRDLGISTAMQQWVASAYLLSLSVLLLVGGRLADLFGRKRMFVTGLWAYAALASAAGLAPNGWILIGARALQGVAGAVLVPTTLAIINATFPRNERGKAIGTWAAWSGITSVLGPLLGGLAVDRVSWHLAFFITPVLALVTLSLSRAVPESRDESATFDLDYLGVALVVASFGGMVFALIEGPIVGWTSPLVLGSAAGGLALLPVFLWWETRPRNPLMPYGMFANRNLAVANVVTLFVYAGLYGMFFYVPIYLQTALGTSATLSAGVSAPITVLLFFLSPVAGRLNDRYGPRWLMCFGPLVGSLGIALAGLTRQGQVFTVLLPGLLLFGVGLGFTVAPVTATAIGSADERYSGVASGFNNAVSRLAGLIAIALMGVIVVQLWQGALAAAKQGSSPQVTTALESVAAKAFVTPKATGLSGVQAREMRAVTEHAAADAFRNGMLLAAALVATGGIVSGVAIRRRQGSDGREDPDESG